MKKKILILLGHPEIDSFNGALARAYAEGAKLSGHDVQEIEISNLNFDPILHHGYKVIQELEPDLKKSQDLIKWCDHLVIISPTWWGSVPAILKGFFDRVFLPGFAFKFRPNSIFWYKLLSGRSARVIVTMNEPVWYYRFLLGAPGLKMINKAILGFSGFSPIRSTLIGGIRSSTESIRLSWIKKINDLGRNVC